MLPTFIEQDEGQNRSPVHEIKTMARQYLSVRMSFEIMHSITKDN
jgi:hypothetical protein